MFEMLSSSAKGVSHTTEQASIWSLMHLAVFSLFATKTTDGLPEHFVDLQVTESSLCPKFSQDYILDISTT